MEREAAAPQGRYESSNGAALSRRIGRGYMVIRHAVMGDAGSIAEAETMCFPPAERASEETIRGRIAAYGEQFWLLTEDDRLAAYICGLATDRADFEDEMYETPLLHDPNGSWHMFITFGASPEFRNKHDAEALLNHAIGDAKARGRKGCVGACKEHMLEYYARFGFRDEGVTARSVLGGAVWHQVRLTF